MVGGAGIQSQRILRSQASSGPGRGPVTYSCYSHPAAYGPSIMSPYLQELPGDPEVVCPGGDGWVGGVDGWISRGRGWGTCRGSDGEGENAPRELCPSSLPPNSGPLHIFLAGAQPFPFNTGGTAPPREGVQGPWERLATVEDQRGEGGPERELPFPSALRKEHMS